MGWVILPLTVLLHSLLPGPAVACHPNHLSGSRSPMSEVAIAVSDLGKTVVAHPGDIILLRLAENPTTGYVWEMGSLDPQLIEVKNSIYQVSPGTGVGRGGIRVFRLQAKAPGTVPLLLKLRRPWESEVEAVDQFSVTLQIQ